MSKVQEFKGYCCFLAPQKGVSPDPCFGLVPEKDSPIDDFHQIMDGDHVTILYHDSKLVFMHGTFDSKKGPHNVVWHVDGPESHNHKLDNGTLEYLFEKKYPIIVQHTVPEKPYPTFG